GEQPNPAGRKALVAVQQLSLTVVFITGAILLVMKNFQVQPWFYAKSILFLVLLSSLMKAFKKDDTILLAQRRAGLGISAISFVAIII
ncbi:SirB2 family protein, partial [Acinetobacter baumannii]|uniref:SirB2 family protein n=1 Tax=Acinetobacter baumannii TaxID=470 RepID=UPI0008105B34